jgi:hypothetical protein
MSNSYPVYMTRGDNVYRVDIEVDDENSSTSSSRDGFYGNDERNLILVWDQTLQNLTDTQRLVFLVLTIFILIVAVIGNLLVLYVNISRYSHFSHFHNSNFPSYSP